jgi:hypothetical protein
MANRVSERATNYASALSFPPRNRLKQYPHHPLSLKNLVRHILVVSIDICFLEACIVPTNCKSAARQRTHQTQERCSPPNLIAIAAKSSATLLPQALHLVSFCFIRAGQFEHLFIDHYPPSSRNPFPNNGFPAVEM